MGSTSSKQQPEYNLGALEATYKSWLDQAESDKSKTLSNMQSRLAASGMKPGSDQWLKSMEKVELDYQNQLKLINETETKKLIDSIKQKKAEEEKLLKSTSEFQRQMLEQAAAGGEEHAMSVLSRSASKSYYEIGGAKVKKNTFGGGPGSSGISAMGPATGV